MVIESGMVLCVRASSRRHWVPVPIEKRGQETSVKLCSGQRWLQQVLVGGRTDRDALDASLAIKAFEQHVRAHVGSLPSACSQKKTDAAEASRKRRLLDDSDDEGDSAKPSTGGSASASSPDSQPKQRQQCLAFVGFKKVPLGEDEVEMGFHKGPGLQVKADAATVKCVVHHLDSNYDTYLAAGRNLRARKSENRKGGLHELLDRVPEQCSSVSNRTSTVGVDSKRIRFDFRRGAYLIMYKDEGGETRQLSKGLEVPRTDYTGNVMCEDSYSQAKTQVLIKARLKWNTLDRSGAPRFPVHDGVPHPQP